MAEGTRIRLTEVPYGDKNYGGGSGRRTSMGLFVTVAGPDAGSGLPSTGSPALFGSAGRPTNWASWIRGPACPSHA